MSEGDEYRFYKNLASDLMLATFGVGLFYVIAKRYGNVRRMTHHFHAYAYPLGKKRVLIANNASECEKVVSALKLSCAKYRILGFDCEWVSSDGIRRPVALLQLATKNGDCALIRLCKFSDIPSDLQKLLDDSSVLKVGVVPSDDAEHLQKDYGLVVNGCLDLRHLVVRNGGVPKGGLAGLAENVLGVKLDKSWRVRCSNWEAENLVDAQVNYAAHDALVAVKIFEVLIQGRLKHPNFLTYLYRHFVGSDHDLSMCDQYVDVKFKGGRVRSPETSAGKPRQPFKPFTRAFCTRQSPLYQNCYMQAPDGVVLCTCDRRKAIWYVSKNLAELICEDPVTVRLKFEPSGRAVGTVGQYYAQEKSNCCVVCGKMNTCLRKNIVPHEYRKHFPKVMKDHVSHDVLLMCLFCHRRSNLSDTVLRRKLADQCNAPFTALSNTKLFEDPTVKAVQTAAKALLMRSNQIPLGRKKELEKVIFEYYEIEEVTKEVLAEAYKLNPCIPNENYEPHGLKVVQFYSEESNGGIVKLEQLWREHFLEVMKPKFLPNLWSVTHTQDRLAIRATENRVTENELRLAGMACCTPLLDLVRIETENRNGACGAF